MLQNQFLLHFTHYSPLTTMLSFAKHISSSAASPGKPSRLAAILSWRSQAQSAMRV
jgi:hypothetical protein